MLYGLVCNYDIVPTMPTRHARIRDLETWAPTYSLILHGGKFLVVEEGGEVPAGWLFPAKFARYVRARGRLPHLPITLSRPRRITYCLRGRWFRGKMGGVRRFHSTIHGRSLRDRAAAERWLRRG